MISRAFLANLPIPPRTSNHRGEWCPLYLEPLPGSGERLCIGVVGTSDHKSFDTLPIPNLLTLSSIFKGNSTSFEWAAKLAILEVREVVARAGIESLNLAMQGFEGFLAGEKRAGAGRDLHDLLSLALRQSSSLAAQYSLNETEDIQAPDINRAGPVTGAVKRIIVGLRPNLRDNFGLQYRFSKSTRSTSFGYVSSRIIANFTSLGAESAQVLATQVDRAKARLWDLEQLQQGILKDTLGVPISNASFELLACPPGTLSKRQRNRRGIVESQMLEASETLEKEADKFDIRWRLLDSPADLAHVVLTREAA